MSPTPKNEVSETSDEVTKKYKEIIKANGIDDEVSEVLIKTSGLQGQGFASQANHVTINFKNPNVKPLNLFVKSHTANSTHSEMLEGGKLFEKESRFFMEYVPAAKEFCKSKGCEGIVDMYPKCYYGDNDLVVLENLVVEKGYVLLDKEEQQDLDAVRFAIATIAKHHAISYAFIQEMGGPENFFKRFPNLDFEAMTQPTGRTMMSPMFDNAINTNVKILEKNKTLEGKNETINFLNSFRGKVFDQLLNVIQYDPEKQKLLVLGHGDYHNNNMMFLKNKETNQIIGHKAIDLQVTRYNSPGLDLGYYLYTSVKPEVRRGHLHEILGRYFDILKETAAKLGHPIDISYEDVYIDFQKTLMLGFWFALCFTGGGVSVIKDLDISKLTDLTDFAGQFDILIQKWIEDHPKEADESAQVALDLVKEYRELSID